MTAGEPAISQLRELPLARLARERGVYLSFNNGRDTEYCIRAHLEPTQLRDWQREVRAQTHSWRRMMAADLGPPPAACGGYCCTQFLVSADRIRARPHSFWRAFPQGLALSTRTSRPRCHAVARTL